jgi:pyruvyltransferase
MLSNNLGDALTPYLIEKITGQTPIYVPLDVQYPKVMVTGSILNHAMLHTTVWGAGFANANDVLHPCVDVRAVRGHITANRLANQVSIAVSVLGDPGLLLPRFYNPEVAKVHKVGICPHYLHQQEVAAWLAGRTDVKFLNVFDHPEKFIDDLCGCEAVFSSSLHGLVLADAYGIPSQWFTGTARLGGDGTKFYDHFSVLWPDGTVFSCFHLSQLPKDVDSLRGIIARPPAFVAEVCNALWAACPFRPE